MKNTYEKNYQICGLKEQLINTGQLLEEKGIAIIVNHFYASKWENHYQLSWPSKDGTKYATGDDLLNIEQFLEIYRLRLFHIMLKDGSLIRFNFIFKNGKLDSQNLLWWPCPFVEFNENKTGLDEVESLMDRLDGQFCKTNIAMRSPIRIDFDVSQERENHPLYHLHTNDSNCRIALDGPLCVNGFLRFILQNFYSDEELDFSEWSYINFKTPERRFLYKDNFLIKNKIE